MQTDGTNIRKMENCDFYYILVIN